jgi:cobalt-zinc-cadmium resistance protein CzcA
VYLPILSLTGIEGKMFHPMAMTVIFALISAFVLSLTFVPAMVALGFGGELTERESRFVEQTKERYLPLLNQTLSHPRKFLMGALGLMGGAIVLAGFLGQEFIPTLDEKNIAVQAIRIPSASLSQSLVMQSQVEKVLTAFPEVDYVFSKTGTAEMATDPMPPNATDTFVMLKSEDQWPDSGKSKLELIQEMEEALVLLPGNLYEFTQPIQMRFNELIAGVRGDVAIKLYGDEFSVLEPTAAKIAGLMAKVRGAQDIKVEQTSGLPLLSVVIDRAAVARYGLNDLPRPQHHLFQTLV